MPKSLSNLQYLQVLKVDHNGLSELPADFSHLTCLEEVDASYNRLSNLPPSLCGCASIRSLAIDNNLLCSLPEELGTMPSKLVDKDWPILAYRHVCLCTAYRVWVLLFTRNSSQTTSGEVIVTLYDVHSTCTCMYSVTVQCVYVQCYSTMCVCTVLQYNVCMYM